ncbi:MAG: glutathione S-transferase [Alphaproteobacteria bacterium]|nr:glutathione S-transferase [Alphaproteobacteria bacterium]
MVRLEIAALYAGVNILILLALAFMVVRARQRHKVVLGVGDQPEMIRAARAHANAAEYIPAGITGLAILALLDAAPVWLLHAGGLSLTIGRIAHGVGLNLGDMNAGRGLGILLTWLSFLLIGGGLIYAALAQQL